MRMGKNAKQNRGFTLVEVMISLLLWLIVSLGTMQLFLWKNKVEKGIASKGEMDLTRDFIKKYLLNNYIDIQNFNREETYFVAPPSEVVQTYDETGGFEKNVMGEDVPTENPIAKLGSTDLILDSNTLQVATKVEGKFLYAFSRCLEWKEQYPTTIADVVKLKKPIIASMKDDDGLNIMCEGSTKGVYSQMQVIFIVNDQGQIVDSLPRKSDFRNVVGAGFFLVFRHNPPRSAKLYMYYHENNCVYTEGKDCLIISNEPPKKDLAVMAKFEELAEKQFITKTLIDLLLARGASPNFKYSRTNK